MQEVKNTADFTFGVRFLIILSSREGNNARVQTCCFVTFLGLLMLFHPSKLYFIAALAFYGFLFVFDFVFDLIYEFQA